MAEKDLYRRLANAKGKKLYTQFLDTIPSIELLGFKEWSRVRWKPQSKKRIWLESLELTDVNIVSQIVEVLKTFGVGKGEYLFSYSDPETMHFGLNAHVRLSDNFEWIPPILTKGKKLGSGIELEDIATKVLVVTGLRHGGHYSLEKYVYDGEVPT